MTVESAVLINTIVTAIDDRSARGIARTVGRQINQDILKAGTRLPTVRALATALGASPARIDEAWRILAGRGVIETQGRRGTYVRPARHDGGSSRWWGLAGEHRFQLELSAGAADHDLLPDLDAALSRSTRRLVGSGYEENAVLPELEEEFRCRWRAPGEPERVTVVNGGLDGFDRLFGVLIRFGDRVVVEEPGYPPILDLLDAHGAEPVPVHMDEAGVTPASLASALETRPVAAVLQPRAQNPTGISMTAARSRELAKVLASAPDVVVLEDDHSADIAWSRPRTLAKHLPHRTVRVASVSKSHGPDLRLAIIGGPDRIIEPLVDRQRLGPGWASRLSQTLLLAMLQDPIATSQVRHARSVYADRRRHLVAELDRLEVSSTGNDGINLWVSVRREREAVRALAAQGISVAPGSPFFLRRDPPGFVRITCGVVAGGYAELAVAIAGAARPAAPSRGSAL